MKIQTKIKEAKIPQGNGIFCLLISPNGPSMRIINHTSEIANISQGKKMKVCHEHINIKSAKNYNFRKKYLQKIMKIICTQNLVYNSSIIFLQKFSTRVILS
jgi:hypothetical protein